MKETYEEAITRVFEDEGGYSNDPGDSGGPTKYGITIHDARMYWKSNASASDVRNMPKSVAEEIYVKHYAIPIRYDDLPAGVDYAVLDYGINSGVGRALRVLKNVQKTKTSPVDVINAIYDERERFLRGLGNFPTFGRGWLKRTRNGRRLALDLNKHYGKLVIPVEHTTAGGVVIAGGGLAAQFQEYAPYILAGTIIIALLIWAGIRYYKQLKGKQK